VLVVYYVELNFTLIIYKFYLKTKKKITALDSIASKCGWFLSYFKKTD